MTVIAMTREMGTLGKDVAREFARRNSYTVFHHELVESPGERNRRDEESEVYRFLEGSEEGIEAWRTNRAKGGYLTPEEVFEIAREGDALIRGWGACRLLKSVPNVLSVRILAPMDFRINQIKLRLGVDERTAQREIERSDAAHGRTFLRFFDSDWRDPVNYDVVLNTAHMSPGECADLLCAVAASPAFAETDESRRVLEDRLLEARIATALQADQALGARGRHIRIGVQDLDVRLYGVVTDGLSRQRAEAVVKAQAGVRSLLNDIVRVGKFESV
jgi:hypothetical protein